MREESLGMRMLSEISGELERSEGFFVKYLQVTFCTRDLWWESETCVVKKRNK